ncbi:hypothetical protein F0562_026015 [Nyssa sinensis]|uniref:WPP domain-associated protein n=1 Tax=Nyssa sinensis TaxID=561372 RepID=A0A5J5B7V7_9ASTE|nr:hypothetical protein F0562_026015 [Nyssa sinensis]
MLRLLKSAMDKAHKRLQTKDGPIERLNESSKFYELAIIQLEGCLRLVQEETDSYILESSHEMLSDLMEIKERLKGRLKGTKLAIVRIDRELMKRSENEFKLMQALELREREVASLRANLKLGRTRSEGAQEFVLSNQPRGNEGKEGDICELKNSLDQQVWNIKQKLEDERIHLTNGIRKMNFGSSNLGNLEPDSEMVSEEGNWHWHSENKDVGLYGSDDFEIKSMNYCLRPEQNIVIEQMSSDMDILKGTLDLAFGKMQKAEVRPLEKQWRWTIEKNTVSILIRGFMSDLQQNFEAELRKKAYQVPVGLSNEHWSGMIDEITSLCHELEAVTSQNEVQVKKVEGHDSSAPLPNVRRTSSEPLPDVDYMKDLPEEDLEADGNQHVAKMIKNHESIIRKQREELNWLRREILQRKGYLSGKGDKDHSGLERRIRGVIVRLHNVIKWNAKLGESKGVHERVFQEEKTSKSDIADKERMSIDISSHDHEKVGNVFVSRGLDAELDGEIRKMKQERDDSNLHTIIMEEIYIILFRGLMKDFYLELFNYDTESLIRDDTCIYVFREMIKEWNVSFESKSLETLISGDIYYIVCSEAVKDFGSNHGFTLIENRDDRDECNMEGSASSLTLLHYLESTIREDVYAVFFKEMVKKWNMSMESHATESLVREQIYRIVFDETVKHVKETANLALSQHQEVRDPEYYPDNFPCTSKLQESIESLLKEDVYMEFFREMVKAWKSEREAYDIENLIREEIYQFIIIEAVKDAHVSPTEGDELSQEKISEDLISSERLDKRLVVSGEENLIQKINCLLQCFKVEEDLMLRASSEIKEFISHHVLVGLEYEDLDEHDTIELWTKEDVSTISSVSNKLEKALQPLDTSKALLRELGYSLGIEVVDLEMVCDQRNPIMCVPDDRKQTFCQPNDNQVDQLNLSDSVFPPLPEFPQVLVDVGHLVSDILMLIKKELTGRAAHTPF